MWEKIKALLENLGIEVPKEKEDKVKDEINKIVPVTGPGQEKKNATQEGSEMSEALKTIKAQQAQIQELSDLIKDMKKDRDESVAAQKEKLEADRQKKIENLKKKGIEEGRITEAKWNEKWKAIAEKDPEQFESILSDLSVDKSLVKNSDGGKTNESQKTAYKGPLSGANPTMLEAMNKMDN